MLSFNDLSLSQKLRDVLARLGFVVPTEIQAKAIPLLLSTKKIDFHGQAQTGTGKTLAFGIPLIESINSSNRKTQAMIIAPTRELAVQIYESLEPLASSLGISVGVIYGGVSLEDQLRKLKKGLQIVVGTPGRVNDHLRRKSLDPSTLSTLVLDEADIMLDMGFKEEIEEILKFLPSDRQIWLFSATVKAGIAALIKKYMKDTISVRISPTQVAAINTAQYYCIVPFRSRIHAITRFIQSVPEFYGFIFCQTKLLASEVADELLKRGYNAAALHGDLSQQQRNRVIKKFRDRENTVLVATDVAARGIDVPDVTHVLQYSVPEDLESYIHRIGRTGRAGQKGTAITFMSKSEQRTINHIERRFGARINPIDVPSAQLVIEKRLDQIPAYLIDSEKRRALHEDLLIQFLEPWTAEQLKKIAVHLLADRFFASLDLEEIPYTHVDKDEGQFQEIYIDVGSDDGITQEDIRNFVLKTGVIKSDQIKTIRVIKRRSFIKLSSDCSPALVQSLRDKKLNGRPVRINVTCMVQDKHPAGNQQDRSRYRRRTKARRDSS